GGGGGGMTRGGANNSNGGYTALASTAPSSPRSSLDVERSATMSSLAAGTASERSLASAFAALPGMGKVHRDQRPGEHDYLPPSRSRMSVNTTAPRVSFNLPRGSENGATAASNASDSQTDPRTHTHDLYSNPW